MSAASELRAGHIVLLDTDTLPGLHGLAERPETVQKLTALKGAPEGRPYLLLFTDLASVLRYARPRDERDVLALQDVWPGPLTALLKPGPQAPAHWAQGGKLAARVPDSSGLRSLLEEVGPVFSTSANRTGEPPPATLAEASARFPDLAAFAWGDTAARSASTLVDLTLHPAEVLRRGPAPWPPGAAATPE